MNNRSSGGLSGSRGMSGRNGTGFGAGRGFSSSGNRSSNSQAAISDGRWHSFGRLGALPGFSGGRAALEVRRTQAFLAVREDRMEAGIRSADLTVHLVSQVRALVDSAIHLSLGHGSGRVFIWKSGIRDQIHRCSCLVARGSTPHAASTDSLVLATEHLPADSEHAETFSELPASGVVSVSAGALASIAASASGGVRLRICLGLWLGLGLGRLGFRMAILEQLLGTRVGGRLAMVVQPILVCPVAEVWLLSGLRQLWRV